MVGNKGCFLLEVVRGLERAPFLTLFISIFQRQRDGLEVQRSWTIKKLAPVSIVIVHDHKVNIELLFHPNCVLWVVKNHNRGFLMMVCKKSQPWFFNYGL